MRDNLETDSHYYKHTNILNCICFILLRNKQNETLSLKFYPDKMTTTHRDLQSDREQ